MVTVPFVFVQLCPVGVTASPLTLKIASNVAVPAFQSITVGLIVTTASGPVSPFAPFSASLTGADQLFGAIVWVAFFPTTVAAITHIGSVPVDGILIDHPLFIVPAVIL